MLLELDGLAVHYPLHAGLWRRVVGWQRAVDGVSLAIAPGQAMGLVGESGCGKSTLARAVMGLAPVTAGAVRYRGVRISGLGRAALRPYRKRLQMIFQDPAGALNPRRSVAQCLEEPLEIHFPDWDAPRRRARAAELLRQVGLLPAHLARYPHELSGGQRQRVTIARALAVEPELLILDEPLSALDVSVQAQIVNLLAELRERLGLSYLFISHDLALVQQLCDEVLVMQAGKLVERLASDRLEQAEHPYTRKLLAAVPRL
ncbi:MAG TPA: ABC transporter ATP-binding protein [Candidatus Competibacteraceae bacterium]|nr:ABC transporter ATP-binding protein [Candidatus Competibacteraceae bacterium]